MSKHKPRATKQREGRWGEIMNAYRRRHRHWVMEYLPTMPDAQWKLYETWVAGFGALKQNQASRGSRKLRRQLKETRQAAVVSRQDALSLDAEINNLIHGIRKDRARATRRT